EVCPEPALESLHQTRLRLDILLDWLGCFQLLEQRTDTLLHNIQACPEILRALADLLIKLHPEWLHARVLQPTKRQVVFGVNVGLPYFDRLALGRQVLQLATDFHADDLFLDVLFPGINLGGAIIILFANWTHGACSSALEMLVHIVMYCYMYRYIRV